MLISIILLFLVPFIVAGLTFIMAGDDIIGLFRGDRSIFGKLFSDLSHILVLWMVGAGVELWLIWTVLSHIL